MSGNGSMGEDKPRGVKNTEMVSTVCRLGLRGKKERDSGQKLTLGKHKSNGQEDQEKGPTEEATSFWMQIHLI